MHGMRRGLSALSTAVIALTVVSIFGGKLTAAQDNYKLQVFGSETAAPKTTFVELHNILIADGTKSLDGSRFAPNGLYATNDALHETVEVTQGLTDWAEVGFYIFTSAQSGWVGVGWAIISGRRFVRRRPGTGQ